MTPPSGNAGPGLPGVDSSGRNTLAVLGAFCFFLSAVEFLVPKPLPFMRIGLANMPLLLGLNVLGARDFFLLALLKVLGQALLGGTFLSFVFLFSLAGTFASALTMYALRFVSGGRAGGKRLGFVGIGCAGAMVSNGVQLLLARHFVFGEAVRYLAPPFLAAGFVAGIVLGAVCERFCRRSLWYASLSGSAAAGFTARGSDAAEPEPGAPEATAGEKPARASPGAERRLRRGRFWDGLFDAEALFVAGLLMALVFLLDRSLPGLLARFLFFSLLVWVAGGKTGPAATAAFILGIVFFNLLVPHGRVLFELGPLRVTQGALLSGLERAVTLAGLTALSRVCVKGDLRLPGKPGALLAEALRTLELMRKKIPSLRKGRLLSGIDEMMLELDARESCAPRIPPAKNRRGLKGVLLPAALVALAALAGLAGLVPAFFLPA